MTSLKAIILQTIRAAFREKVALCLLVLLVLVIGLLPVQLKGDGTAEGRIQLLLRYGMGLSMVLLSLTAVWMASASISSEIKNKQLFMVLSKPLSRSKLWLGKWIGLMLLQAILCAACGLGVYIQVERFLRLDHVPDAEEQRLREEVAASRIRVQPILPDLKQQAQERVNQEREAGTLPAGRSEAEMLRELENFLRLHEFSVHPGKTKSWPMELGKPVRAGEVLHVSTRLDGATLAHRAHLAEWVIGTTEQPELIRIPLQLSAGNKIQFRLNEDGSLNGATSIQIALHNQHQERNMIFLDADHGLNLFRPSEGFGVNILRVMLIAWALLGILTGIGLSAGAVFSFPVAVYLTSFFLLLHSVQGLVQQTSFESSANTMTQQESGIVNGLNRAGSILFDGMNFVMRPVRDGIPLNDLARGTTVSWRRVGRQLGGQMLPALLVIGGLGIWGFRRHEVGDAS